MILDFSLISEQVGSIEEAAKAKEAGVDGIIVQGREAGGHVIGQVIPAGFWFLLCFNTVGQPFTTHLLMQSFVHLESSPSRECRAAFCCHYADFSKNTVCRA